MLENFLRPLSLHFGMYSGQLYHGQLGLEQAEFQDRLAWPHPHALSYKMANQIHEQTIAINQVFEEKFLIKSES